MSERRFPPSLSTPKPPGSMPKAGYVRSNATHSNTQWSFEVLDDESRVLIVTIETADGPLHIGLNRDEATALQQKLSLFLADLPRDQAKS